jgi:UDP-N-acetylmuramyl pentapeptide phosphotransferase/UDP-N-acetylglucosamine-1-phosphate transferase
LSARLKFIVFSALALAAALIVGPVSAFPIANDVFVSPYWLALFGTALWVFVMVNAVNFMDGANGLAMGSVAIGLAALCAISWRYHSFAGVTLTACTVGAIVGFLIWNFPRGLLFAGDSGSLFAGALAALVSVIVIHRAAISPLVPAIVFFPLLADALITLAWRVYKRHSLLDGHSEHVYQILMHGGVSHAEVAFMYWTAMAVCGGIGFLVAEDPGVAAWVALASMAFLAIVVSAVVRRFASRRNVGGV